MIQHDKGAEPRLPTRTIAAFAAAAVPVGALTTPLLVYLPNYYAAHVGIPIAVVGAAFMLVKLLDIVFDPLMGMAMDHTRTRIGRYRFWLVVGAPVLMIAAFALFMAPRGVGAGYLFGWLALLYAGFSLVVLAQSAWGAVLARSYNERSRAYAWATVLGTAGAVAVLLLPQFLPKGGAINAVQAMGLFIVCATPIAAAIVAFGVPEPVAPRRVGADRLKLSDIPELLKRPSLLRLLGTDLALTLGPGFTSPLYLFFFRQARGYSESQANILLLLYIVAALFAAPLWARISYRLGKHRTLYVAAGAYAALQAALVLLPAKVFAPMAVGMILAGGVASSFTFLVRSMLADVGDEVRLDTGKERTGLLYAFTTSTAKIGTAGAVGVTYWILSEIGFDPAAGAANTPEALHGLVLTYVILPVVMVAVGGLVMIGYRLDERRHAEIRTQLEARDAASRQAATEVETTVAVPPLVALEPGASA